MNEKIVLLIVFLVVSVGLLSGCTEENSDDDNYSENDESNNINEESDSVNDESSKFLGIWKTSDDEYTLILFSDGTGSYNKNEVYWNIKDGKLVLDVVGSSVIYTYDYVFSEDGNMLTVTSIDSGRVKKYTKQ